MEAKLRALDNYRNKGFSNALLIFIVYMAGVTKYISDPESIFMLVIVGIMIIFLLPEIFFFQRRRRKLFEIKEGADDRE